MSNDLNKIIQDKFKEISDLSPGSSFFEWNRFLDDLGLIDIVFGNEIRKYINGSYDLIVDPTYPSVDKFLVFKRNQPVHTFVFNENNNSGESLSLTTKLNENGMHQSLSLMSYSNSASFDLAGASFTPEKLRKLADELEGFLNGQS